MQNGDYRPADRRVRVKLQVPTALSSLIGHFSGSTKGLSTQMDRPPTERHHLLTGFIVGSVIFDPSLDRGWPCKRTEKKHNARCLCLSFTNVCIQLDMPAATSAGGYQGAEENQNKTVVTERTAAHCRKAHANSSSLSVTQLPFWVKEQLSCFRTVYCRLLSRTLHSIVHQTISTYSAARTELC